MARQPIRILLQTTIPPTADDWGIARFSLLTQLLHEARDGDGRPFFTVTARDRDPPGAPDPVLSTLDVQPFDELWLFAVDTGDGLAPADCDGITRFRRRGGGLLLTRDHMDLGASLCALDGVGAAHFFHTRNIDPDTASQTIDDTFSTKISWPNYHSGANGDAQVIAAVAPVHPVLADPTSPTGAIRQLPAHPHEGAVGVPSGSGARVIATGTSKVSGRSFNIAVAFEADGGSGRAVAQSTFHHFADYNWDTAMGCPSFVDEPPGDAMMRDSGALADTHRYMLNLAQWLGGRD